MSYKLLAGLLGFLAVFAACGGSTSPAASPTAIPPTPTPTPTVAQQREAAVQFLRRINAASNNAQDTLASARLGDWVQSGDLLELNKALTTIVPSIQAFTRQVNEINPPTEVSETAALKDAELRAAAKLLSLFESFRAAIQAGDRPAISRLAGQFEALEADPEVNRPGQLQQTLLAKYNIPDSEVNYRRAK